MRLQVAAVVQLVDCQTHGKCILFSSQDAYRTPTGTSAKFRTHISTPSRFQDRAGDNEAAQSQLEAELAAARQKLVQSETALRGREREMERLGRAAEAARGAAAGSEVLSTRAAGKLEDEVKRLEFALNQAQVNPLLLGLCSLRRVYCFWSLIVPGGKWWYIRGVYSGGLGWKRVAVA
jgi:hypothetical protein